MGDSREEKRHEIEVWGFYRTPNGGKRDIPIKDLSETGCRFYDKFSGLRAGEEINLKIEALGPYAATVRWQEGGYVGVEFQSRLYGPMFDHIRLRLSRK